MKVLLDEGVEPFVCMPRQIERLSGYGSERKIEASAAPPAAIPDNRVISNACDIA
jgi:hypothetical protein